MIPLESEIFALATDTIWGLACYANNLQAVKQIFALKNRGTDKPLVLFVDTQEMAQSIQLIPDDLQPWLNKQWPGPLTFVSKSVQDQYSHCHPHTAWVGVRIPNHLAPLSLIQKIESPLAVTSFNLSGELPVQGRNEILRAFPDVVKRIFGSMNTQNHESVVLRLDQQNLEVLRGTKVQVEILRLGLPETYRLLRKPEN
jgi:L-threonylcarbamoyladenylate synthase